MTTNTPNTKPYRLFQTVVFLLLFNTTVFGQVSSVLDFNLPGFYLMPSETGVHNDKWVLGSYINTKKILSNLPIRSYILYGDYQIIRGLQSLYVGVGIGEMSLVSSLYHENEFYSTIAYHKIIRKHTIDVGIQPGILLRSIDANKLLFPDQYDRSIGGFSSSITTNEPIEVMGNAYSFNLNIGAAYGITLGKYKTKFILAYRNINKPNLSFTQNPVTIPQELIIQNKTNFHFTTSDFAELFIMVRSSSDKTEYFGGGEIKHSLYKYNLFLNEISVGSYMVIRDNSYPNNIVFNLGFSLQKLKIGLAYSYNFLGNGTKSDFNTFEIAILYKGLNNSLDQYRVPCEIY